MRALNPVTFGIGFSDVCNWNLIGIFEGILTRILIIGIIRIPIESKKKFLYNPKGSPIELPTGNG